MMVKKQPISFDEIIQSDRQKKQHEQLASQLLGKNRNKKERRASAPGPGAVSKAPNAKPGSLASRIGVPKRSASASFQTKPTKQTRQSNLAPATVASARTRAKPNKRQPNAEKLQAAIESGRGQANIREPKNGLSVKGASGPFVVTGSNFAPGTTAADIQSALEPVSGPMLSCRVVNHHPSVTAEFAYADKWTAENVVANFHNQRADGRVLSMILKPVGAGTHISTTSTPFDQRREQADRERRQRRAKPDVQDGSYGFSEQGSLKQSSGFHSDQMMVDAPAKRIQNQRRRQ